MSTPSSHRVVVALAFPTQVSVLVSLAQAIVLALTANKDFPSPDPTLAAVTAAVADLEQAQAAAQSRTKGAVPVRNEKRTALVGLLRGLKGYVQKVVDAAPDAEHAVSLVHAAGMNAKRQRVPAKRAFGVTPGPVSGSVVLTTAVAAQRASYEWGYSADGGKTWVAAPVTLKTRATLVGLVPGTVYAFRSRSVTKTGTSDWTAVVTLLVK
jgi:hypothetical protein